MWLTAGSLATVLVGFAIAYLARGSGEARSQLCANGALGAAVRRAARRSDAWDRSGERHLCEARRTANGVRPIRDHSARAAMDPAGAPTPRSRKA